MPILPSARLRPPWPAQFLSGLISYFTAASSHYSLGCPSPGHEAAGLRDALAVLGAGWVVMPLGALFFGRLGDRISRRPTFLITIVLMGGDTVGIGLLPTYATAGILAPILFVLLRLAQGLAVGGEYGGAAIQVAEHSPVRHRGLNTSLMMGTGTVGLLHLAAIMATRTGRRQRVRGLGLATAASGLGAATGVLGLHAHATRRIADV